MRLSDAELQSWVLKLVDRACANQPVESSHVELKSQWPEPKDAARFIAAMCNAAGGHPVLLIVGVDEKQAQVCGADSVEVANWWPRVEKEFDREAPSMIRTSPVHIGGSTVVALLFESLRAPYVIKNPVAGQPGGGPVQYEVPWREGNSTRTARKEHLLRMVVPAVGVPALEVLGGTLRYFPSDRDTWCIDLNLEFFASLHRLATLVGHRTKVVIEPDQLGTAEHTQLERTFQEELLGGPSTLRALTLHSTSSFRFLANGYSRCIGPILPHELRLHIEFAIDRSDLVAPIDIRMNQGSADDVCVEYVPAT